MKKALIVKFYKQEIYIEKASILKLKLLLFYVSANNHVN